MFMSIIIYILFKYKKLKTPQHLPHLQQLIPVRGESLGFVFRLHLPVLIHSTGREFDCIGAIAGVNPVHQLDRRADRFGFW